MEGQLTQAEILDPKKLKADGKVVFGAHVDLYEFEVDARVTYQIVGELEAELDKGQISLTSPIGRALIGKYEGDEVEVQTPGGTRGYEIVKVHYK